jgi:hypothetical protein
MIFRCVNTKGIRIAQKYVSWLIISPIYMKKVPAFIFSLLIISVLVYSLSSCSKTDRSKDTDLQSSRDMSLAYACWNDLNRQLNDFAGSQPELNAVPGPVVLNVCGAVTVTPPSPSLVFPKYLTINYGNANCGGPDGSNRRGQIIASFTGNYRDSLSVITISTNNYYFNDYKVDGNFTIINKGRNAAGHPWFKETAANAVFTNKNGTKVAFNFNQNREMIQGDTTLLVFDDVYQLTGTGGGISSDGNPITAYIDQPLVFSMDCPWIKSGTLYLDPTNLGNRFINFGAGQCDNTADVWIYGDKYTLYLD